jgi:hypothetical protein
MLAVISLVVAFLLDELFPEECVIESARRPRRAARVEASARARLHAIACSPYCWVRAPHRPPLMQASPTRSTACRGTST